MQNVSPPTGLSGTEVVRAIRSMVQSTPISSGGSASDHYRPAHIVLFKAYRELSNTCNAPSDRVVQLRGELQSSGVTLADTPHGGRKNKADFMLASDMMAFALDFPAPARLVLISGDGDLAYNLATLHGRGYQVILVVPSLASSATILRKSADVVLRFREDVLYRESTAATAVVPAMRPQGLGSASAAPPSLATSVAPASPASQLPVHPRATSTPYSPSCSPDSLTQLQLPVESLVASQPSSAVPPSSVAPTANESSKKLESGSTAIDKAGGFMTVLLRYAPLIELLLTLPPDGSIENHDGTLNTTRHLRAKVAGIIQRDHGFATYLRAGAGGWSNYAAEAERIGLVQLGRGVRFGTDWIELVQDHALVQACKTMLKHHPNASLPTVQAAVAMTQAAQRPPIIVQPKGAPQSKEQPRSNNDPISRTPSPASTEPEPTPPARKPLVSAAAYAPAPVTTAKKPASAPAPCGTIVPLLGPAPRAAPTTAESTPAVAVPTTLPPTPIHRVASSPSLSDTFSLLPPSRGLRKSYGDVVAEASEPTHQPIEWTKKTSPPTQNRTIVEPRAEAHPTTTGKRDCNFFTKLWRRHGDTTFWLKGVLIPAKFSLLVRALQDQRAAKRSTSTPDFLLRLYRKLHGQHFDGLPHFLEYLEQAESEELIELLPRWRGSAPVQFLTLHPRLCDRDPEGEVQRESSEST